MRGNVFIKHPHLFQDKKNKMMEDGPGQLVVISDFDRTITKLLHFGKASQTTYGVLPESGLLSEKYVSGVKALFKKYFPIEISHEVPREVKVDAMLEWWQNSNQLLVDENIKISLIREMVKKGYFAFRDKCSETFNLLESHKIPLIIFSGGIHQVIEEMLIEKENKIHSNIRIVTNLLIVNEEEKVVGFSDPIIHVFNKNGATIVKYLEHEESYKQDFISRKNVILIGDSTGDVHMADGLLDMRHCIKIGFFNEDNEERLNIYKEIFDVVITDDGSFDNVYELITDIINGKET
jgi:5'-nucleotidase